MVDTIIVGRYLGKEALAGGGIYRFYQLYDYRLLHRHLRRLCHTRWPSGSEPGILTI